MNICMCRYYCVRLGAHATAREAWDLPFAPAKRLAHHLLLLRRITSVEQVLGCAVSHDIRTRQSHWALEHPLDDDRRSIKPASRWKKEPACNSSGSLRSQYCSRLR